MGQTLAENTLERERKLPESFSAPIGTITLDHEDTRATRKKLPDTGPATRHKFDISGTKGYIHTGTYEDGCPGEVFVTLTKEGSTMQGLLGTVAKLTSMLLQRGVTTIELLEDFAGTRFEPHGLTSHPDKDMKTVSSIVDYLFRYLYKIDPTNKEALERSDGDTGDLCSSCGYGSLVHEEGCMKCYHCGYSSC